MNKENEFLVKRYIFSYLILKIKIFTGIYFNYFQFLFDKHATNKKDMFKCKRNT